MHVNCISQSVSDLLRWVPSLSFVKTNEIGGSFNFWELNGDKLQCLNKVQVRKGALNVRKGASRFVKVCQGASKVHKGA